jgi:hypothetical protein
LAKNRNWCKELQKFVLLVIHQAQHLIQVKRTNLQALSLKIGMFFFLFSHITVDCLWQRMNEIQLHARKPKQTSIFTAASKQAACHLQHVSAMQMQQ